MKTYRIAVAGLLVCGLANAQPLNVLFYGNSYSMRNGTVPDLVEFIAEEAGHPAPFVLQALSSGTNLAFHRNDPGQVAAISSLPIGQDWDYVVIQGESVEATATLGNQAVFRQNARGILLNVRGRSPQAKAAMFQTWARGVGHSFYSATFRDPLAMHDEIRASYRAAVNDMATMFGAGTATNGAAGDALAILGFSPAMYEADLSHPLPRTTLLTAMVVFTAVYRQLACDVQPDFGGTSRLIARLQSLGLTSFDWDFFSSIADRVADPSVRPYPGSNEDLVLRTSSGGSNGCPIKPIRRGDLLTVSMTSPNKTYAADSAAIVIDLFATGAPPGPFPGFAEVRFSPARAGILVTRPQLGNQLLWLGTIPFSFPGYSLLIQGMAAGPSPTTGNVFTMTDAHEFQFQ